MTTEENTFPFHAHVSTSSRDCDGGHGFDYIEEMSNAEKAGDWPEYEFINRVIISRVSFVPERGQTIKIDDDGFSWHETTDEGYSAGEAKWCRDDCNLDDSSQYDQYAEMSGY